MRQVSFGTAWLSDRGYFLTASHVVQDGAQVFLRSVDGRVEEAIVVINDQRNDLAVLRANIPSGSSGLSLARSGTPLGARVYTMGFPHPNVLGVTPKFTAGEVNAVAGLGDDPRILQVSNPVQSGNSGGPLLNTFGEVVGQISAKLSATEIFRTTGDLPQNVNYALKGSYIGAILEDFPAGSSAPRPLKPKTAEEIATAVRKAIFLVIAQ